MIRLVRQLNLQHFCQHDVFSNCGFLSWREKKEVVTYQIVCLDPYSFPKKYKNVITTASVCPFLSLTGRFHERRSCWSACNRQETGADSELKTLNLSHSLESINVQQNGLICGCMQAGEAYKVSSLHKNSHGHGLWLTGHSKDCRFCTKYIFLDLCFKVIYFLMYTYLHVQLSLWMHAPVTT